MLYFWLVAITTEMREHLKINIYNTNHASSSLLVLHNSVHTIQQKKPWQKEVQRSEIPPLFKDLNKIKLIYLRLHSSANKYNLVQKRILTRKLKDIFYSEIRGKKTFFGVATLQLQLKRKTSSVWWHHGVIQVITVAFFRVV